MVYQLIHDRKNTITVTHFKYIIILHLQKHLLSIQTTSPTYNGKVGSSYLSHNAVVCGVWASTSIWTFESSFSAQFSLVTLQKCGKIVNGHFLVKCNSKAKWTSLHVTSGNCKTFLIANNFFFFFLWPIPEGHVKFCQVFLRLAK